MNSTEAIVFGSLVGLIVWVTILNLVIKGASKSAQIEKHLAEISEKLSKLIELKNPETK